MRTLMTARTNREALPITLEITPALVTTTARLTLVFEIVR